MRVFSPDSVVIMENPNEQQQRHEFYENEERRRQLIDNELCEKINRKLERIDALIDQCSEALKTMTTIMNEPEKTFCVII